MTGKNERIMWSNIDKRKRSTSFKSTIRIEITLRHLWSAVFSKTPLAEIDTECGLYFGLNCTAPNG